MRNFTHFCFYTVVVILLLTTIPSLAQELQHAADIISVQGIVEILPADTEIWVRAKDFQKLYPKDTIRTSERSRAAILFIDQTQIKLNENTVLEIKDIKLGAATQISWGRTAKSLFNLVAGEIWIRSGGEALELQVDTPVASATIRGTEFVISADKKKTTVTVVEGSVNLKNAYGEVLLTSGEQGIAEIDKPPYKTVIINPEDAVQWALYYPGNICDKDYYHVPQNEMEIIKEFFRLYREKRLDEAINSVKGTLPGSPRILTLLAFGQLMVGNVKSAKENLDKALEIDPDYSLAHSILSNIYLVQNNKEKARKEAEVAVQTNPNSPSAYISLAWVRQSYFDIPGAIEAAQRAIELDNKNIQAYVTLCRLLFGSDRIKEAITVIEQAITIAPEESTVNATKGFLLLAQGKTEDSIEYFSNSIKQDSTQGLGHLGLGLANIRLKNISSGLREMLIATLLEPKISLYQSYLGKAYYQVGKEYAKWGVKKEEAVNYEKYLKLAEKTLSYASYLDPRDPTPYLYSGILFTDLNRPVDGVEKFNKSIELNDNRAVYRSRLLLDRDLATENISLALAYDTLGLYNWGSYLAMRSVQSGFGIGGAHQFLGHTYLGLRGRTRAAGSELLQARIMSPVNENSFNTYNNYTSLFETPEFNTSLTSRAGEDELREYVGAINGGSGKFAFSQAVLYDYEKGYLPKNNDYESMSTITYLKYALGMRSHIYTSFVSTLLDYGAEAPSWNPFQNDPDYRTKGEMLELAVGYYNQLTPNTYLLLFTKAKEHGYKERDLVFQDTDLSTKYKWSDMNRFWNGQIELVYRYNKHQFICAFDYYDGKDTYDIKTITGSFETNYPSVKSPQRFSSLLLKDYWRIFDPLELDIGLRYDNFEDGDPHYDSIINTSRITPQVGLVFNPFKNATLRIAGIKSTSAHLEETLFPTNTAGFIIGYTERSSSRNTEYAIAWDQIINPKTFFTVSGSYRDRETPYFSSDASGNVIKNFSDDKFIGANLVINRIINRFIALYGEYNFLKTDDRTSKRNDHQVKLRLGFVHPTGWEAQLTETYVYQENEELTVKDPFDASFWTTDASLSYEFPKKRGRLTLSVNNLFDREFEVVTDPLAMDVKRPSRQVILKAEIFF